MSQYSNIKIKLSNFIKKDVNYLSFFKAITNTHKLTINVELFVKLYFIYLFEWDLPFPQITENFIRIVYKVFSITAFRCGVMTAENASLFDSLVKFKNIYFPTEFSVDIDARSLDYIIGYQLTTYMTNLDQNICSNFLKAVGSLVNYEITALNSLAKEKLDNKELKKQLRYIKSDLMNCNDPLKSNPVLHTWINAFKNQYLPQACLNGHSYQIVVDPHKYIKYMIRINKKLEEYEKRPYQIFPLRHSVTEKFIIFDTGTLVKLFVHKEKGEKSNKQELLENIMDNRDTIWAKYFKTNTRLFRRKCYKFDHSISTNGYEVSIRFIRVDSFEKNEQTKKRMASGRKNAKYKIEKLKKAKQESQPRQVKSKTTKENKPKKKAEFEYLEDLDAQTIEHLKRHNIIYIDPGKIRILTMIDNNDKVMKYSSSQRLKETKRLEYQTKREKYSKANGIKKIEEQLNDHSSRTFNLIKFIDYIIVKSCVNCYLYEKYNTDFYKKLQWYSHINKQRSEAKLISRMKGMFGKDACIIIGDWSEKMPIKRISVPGLGIRRLLAKHFKLYLIDEYLTSKLCYHTEEECENLELMTGKGDQTKMRSFHSILTYRMKNGRQGCINRDINAVKNIRKISQNIMNGLGRPEKYKRKVIDKNESGVDNQKSKKSKSKKVKSSEESNVNQLPEHKDESKANQLPKQDQVVKKAKKYLVKGKKPKRVVNLE